jgi:hypothetical protein
VSPSDAVSFRLVRNISDLSARSCTPGVAQSQTRRFFVPSEEGNCCGGCFNAHFGEDIYFDLDLLSYMHLRLSHVRSEGTIDFSQKISSSAYYHPSSIERDSSQEICSFTRNHSVFFS